MLLLLGTVTAGGRVTFSLLEFSCGIGDSLELPSAKLYTVTGMDVVVMAADFATGIWVVAIEVTTVGVGSAGRVGFTGKVRLVGIGWVITLTLNLLFTGTLALFFFSAFLGAGTFLGKEFLLGKNMLVHSRLPHLPSSSKYIFIFLIRDK